VIPILLIVVGAILIVVALTPDKGSTVSDSQPVLFGLSILMWGGAVYLFITACTSPPLTAVWHVVISIGLAIAAYKMWGNAKGSTQELHLNSKIAVKQKEMAYDYELTREKQIEKENKDRVDLAAAQRETQLQAEDVRKKELDLQNELVERGIEHGLIPADVSEVNKAQFLSDIKQKAYKQEILDDLDAGDLYEISEQRVLKKLTNLLTEQIRERHQIEEGDDPPKVKEALLARYDKNITFLEAEIDARQAGLLLPKNQEETLRIGEGEGDSPGQGKSEVQGVQEQIPPQRRRGRPRKNPAE
jgi:hypothetical protein